jgi:hypothetical protein
LKRFSPRNPHISLHASPHKPRGVLAALGAGSLSVLLHGGAEANASPAAMSSLHWLLGSLS